MDGGPTTGPDAEYENGSCGRSNELAFWHHIVDVGHRYRIQRKDETSVGRSHNDHKRARRIYERPHERHSRGRYGNSKYHTPAWNPIR
jgi:hypothetical protein